MESKAKLTKGIKGLLGFMGALAFSLVITDCINLRCSPRRKLREDFSQQVAQARAKRPIMYTFFEPTERVCCGMTKEGHENLVDAWEEAWLAFGWEPKVLRESDAKTHPYFKNFERVLTSAGVNEYDQRCFWRWLAMANLPHGGWMSDYDNIPLSLTGEKGLELQKGGGFKSWGKHVPALLYADQEGWNRIAKIMMNVIKPDLNLPVLSDMMVLNLMHETIPEEQLGITHWSDEMYPGFPYMIGRSGPQLMCNWISQYLTAHISHNGSKSAVRKGTYPIKGVVYEKSAERRGDAARVMYKQAKDCAER